LADETTFGLDKIGEQADDEEGRETPPGVHYKKSSVWERDAAKRTSEKIGTIAHNAFQRLPKAIHSLSWFKN